MDGGWLGKEEGKRIQNPALGLLSGISVCFALTDSSPTVMKFGGIIRG